ncbi:hypothetical protein LguiA_003750 [Lonicera macranthoides]
MALPFSTHSLPHLQIHHSLPRSPKLLSRRHVSPPITASISQNANIPPPSTTAPLPRPASTTLPIKPLPGDYGLPFFGPIQDRNDYFYNQGRDDFFKSRVEKYKSTVFRTNMPPGPFIASDPRVIALLDAKCFPVLFDMSKVEKKDLFTGTYKPSSNLTGGYRILAYLDPAEPSHAKLKQLLFFLLKSRRDRVIPEFRSCFADSFNSLESELKSKKKASLFVVSLNDATDQASFNFLARALCGKNPVTTELGTEGPSLIQKWVGVQLAPVLTLGLPKFIEDLLIHTFSLPSFLVQKDYQRLYNFFYESSTFFLDEAEKTGVSREEACHNLVFATCFNSFGGMKILFPSIIKWVGSAGPELHARLAKEIRSAVKSNGGNISMAVLEQMPVAQSVVYETLRIEPPVASQYGRAKKDFVVESHDSAFEIKKGEMLFGFQPFATKDGRIFENSEEFVADRFVGEGEKLLKYVLWSNGPETDTPAVGNKQCAGKDFVVLTARLFLTEFFLRYDTFEIEVGEAVIGSTVTVTSLTKASS